MRSVRLAERIASPPCVWNQIFTPAKTTATKKNGATRRKSAHRNPPACHQTISSNTSGRIATEPLLSIAKTKASRLSQYHLVRTFSRAKTTKSTAGKTPSPKCFCAEQSRRPIRHSPDERQTTVPPDTHRESKVSTRSPTTTMPPPNATRCLRRDNREYSSPHRRHSIQNVVLVSGQ